MQFDHLLKNVQAYIRQEWTELAINPKSEYKGSVMSQKIEQLKTLEQVCRQCTQCDLYQSARQLVFGDGSASAKIVFIGEGPGEQEDIQGLPFVGRSGQLLRNTLGELGVHHDEIYICNILKHRPPKNRDPLPEEVQACTTYLKQQLEIISPKLIITLGNYATKFILDTTTGITKLRGQFHKSPFGYDVCPTFHPSAILRNNNNLPLFKEDLKKAVDHIRSGV